MEQLTARRLILGLILILAGTILLLDNLNFFVHLPFEVRRLIFNWPMLIMVIGVIALLSRGNKTPGFIIFFIGAYFWLDRYLELDLHLAQIFWPLVIIFIGVYIIVKHSRKTPIESNWQDAEEVKKKNETGSGPDEGTGSQKSSSDILDEVAILGGGNRSVNSIAFKGGKATCIFGGSEINFANAQLINNQPAVIEVLCIFGGISLKVPRDWTVHTEVTPILGGFGDDRDHNAIHPNPSKTLIIKGLVIFGGGDIKSA